MRLAGVRNFAGLAGIGLRALFFRPVSPYDCIATPTMAVVVSILGFFASGAIAYISAGEGAQFSIWGVMAGLSSTVIFLAVLAVAGAKRPGFSVLGLYVTTQMSGLWISLPMTAVLFGLPEVGHNMTSEQIAWYWTGFIAFWFLFAWWVASTWHLGRMATYERSHSLGAWAVVASFLAVFVLPSQELFTSYSSPGYSGGLYDFVVRVTANQEEHRVNHAYVPPEIDVEGTFYRQPTLIDAATRTLAPSRPEKSEIYYVGVAPFASEGVFKNEIIAVRNLLEQRFDANGRSIVLVNHKRTLDRFALANLTNLDAVMQRVGEVMVPEKDVLVLFISSHGLKERISVQFPLFQMNEITANRLAEVLARSKIKNRVIVISACYSGSFIPKLRDANSLIMTAASSDTVSFGCSNDATWTYFGDALFNRALRGTFSFERAFGEAKATIEKWEKEQMLPASEPQIYVGSSIGPVLDRLEEQLEQRNLSAPPPTASENAARASLELGTTLEPGKSSQATATP